MEKRQDCKKCEHVKPVKWKRKILYHWCKYAKKIDSNITNAHCCIWFKRR